RRSPLRWMRKMSSMRVFFSASASCRSVCAFSSRSRTFFRWRLNVRKESHSPSISMTPTTAIRTASAMSEETIGSGPSSRETALNTLGRGYHPRDAYVGANPRYRGDRTDRNTTSAESSVSRFPFHRLRASMWVSSHPAVVQEEELVDLDALPVDLPRVSQEEEDPAGDRTDQCDHRYATPRRDRDARTRAPLDRLRRAGRRVGDEDGDALDRARRDA